MSGWFAAMRSPEASALQREHPSAFLLLFHIASRARWRREPCPLTGLNFAEARIGDYAAAGLKTQKSYRHAKGILQRAGYVAFQGANKGTVATLIDTSIFRIEGGETGEQVGEQTDTPRGGDRGELRGKPGATKKKDRNKKEEGGTPATGEAGAAAASPPTPVFEQMLESLREAFPNSPSNFLAPEREAIESHFGTLSELSAEDWKALRAWNEAPDKVRRRTLWPTNRMHFTSDTVLTEAIEKVRNWWAKEGGKAWWAKHTAPNPPKVLKPPAGVADPAEDDTLELGAAAVAFFRSGSLPQKETPDLADPVAALAALERRSPATAAHV